MLVYGVNPEVGSVHLYPRCILGPFIKFPQPSSLRRPGRNGIPPEPPPPLYGPTNTILDLAVGLYGPVHQIQPTVQALIPLLPPLPPPIGWSDPGYPTCLRDLQQWQGWNAMTTVFPIFVWTPKRPNRLKCRLENGRLWGDQETVVHVEQRGEVLN